MKPTGFHHILPTGLASLILLLPSLAWAAHPLSTDDPGTQGAWGFEVEASTSLNRPSEGGLSFGHGLSLHLGFLDRLDLGLTLGLETGGGLSLGDPTVDVKVRLLEAQGAQPALGLRMDIVPLLEREGSPAGLDLALVALAAWELSPLTLLVNLGVTTGNLMKGSSLPWSLLASTAMLFDLPAHLQAGLEVVYQHEPASDRHALSGLAALICQVRENNFISLGVGPSLELPGSVGWIVTIGYTIAWPH